MGRCHITVPEILIASHLLTVGGDSKSVAHEPDAHMGDMTSWQGALGFTREYLQILAIHVRVEPRAARMQPECREPVTVGISKVQDVPPFVG